MNWIVRLLKPRRAPDFIIGGADNAYIKRWWLIRRNRWLNIYLHQILRDDDDRALHCHPWWNVSILLHGAYTEVMPDLAARKTPYVRIADLPQVSKHRSAGSIIFRRATDAHRLELPIEGGGIRYCWSLFITGPRVREWGFHCERGWVLWRDFVSPSDTGSIGKGCDQ